jgi:hypothetical protein
MRARPAHPGGKDRETTSSSPSISLNGLPPAEQLLPLAYDELRRLAAAKMAREAPGQTLQPTALVHEVWLPLGGDGQPQ